MRRRSGAVQTARRFFGVRSAASGRSTRRRVSSRARGAESDPPHQASLVSGGRCGRAHAARTGGRIRVRRHRLGPRRSREHREGPRWTHRGQMGGSELLVEANTVQTPPTSRARRERHSMGARPRRGGRLGTAHHGPALIGTWVGEPGGEQGPAARPGSQAVSRASSPSHAGADQLASAFGRVRSRRWPASRRAG